MLLRFLLLLVFSTNNYAMDGAAAVVGHDLAVSGEDTAAAGREAATDKPTGEEKPGAPKTAGDAAWERLEKIKNDGFEGTTKEVEARRQIYQSVLADFKKYEIDTTELEKIESIVSRQTDIYLQAERMNRYLTAVDAEMKESPQVAEFLKEKYVISHGVGFEKVDFDDDLKQAPKNLKKASAQLAKAVQNEQSILQKNAKDLFQKKAAAYAAMDEEAVKNARAAESTVFEANLDSMVKAVPKDFPSRVKQMEELKSNAKEIFDQETKIYLGNAQIKKLTADLEKADPKEQRTLKKQIISMEQKIAQDRKSYLKAVAKTGFMTPTLRNILIYGGIAVVVLAIVGFIVGGAVSATSGGSSKKGASSTDADAAPATDTDTAPSINPAPSTQ